MTPEVYALTLQKINAGLKALADQTDYSLFFRRRSIDTNTLQALVEALKLIVEEEENA